MVMLGNVFNLSRHAKSSLVLVALVLPPGMKGSGNLVDVLLFKIPQHPVFHISHVSGVDEQHLAETVPETVARLLIPGQKPDTCRNLCIGEKLAGQGVTMHSTKSFSISAFLICPSLLVLELMEPLAKSKPMEPLGARW